MSESFLRAVALRMADGAPTRSGLDVQALLADTIRQQEAKKPAATLDDGDEDRLALLGVLRISGLVAPQFCACSEDLLYISCATTSRIYVVSPETGGILRTMGGRGSGAGQLNAPSGVACGEGALYVADHFNHRVQKLALADGRSLAMAGRDDCEDGAAAGEFECPEGLTLHGEFVYVADRNNDRVVMLTSTELDWRTSIGEGQLRCPTDVKIAPSTGELVVADSARQRVCVFADATLARVIDGLCSPAGLLVLDHLLVVADEVCVRLLAWPRAKPCLLYTSPSPRDS